MGDIAKCSIGGSESYFYNEELLYKLFGVNAELLIEIADFFKPSASKIAARLSLSAFICFSSAA